MKLNYRLLNVFTDGAAALSGNPLCVFEDGSELDAATMQALALQFNLSETTFLLPSTVANARVRIFTPQYEMPFAGHPTLGTAAVCRALKLGADSLSLEMSAGIIPVVAQGRRWTLTAKGSSWRELELPRERLALLLGLSAADVLERPLWVQSGREQLLVPLASERAVRSASLQGAALDSLGGADNPGVYVFAFASPQRAVARFFFAHGAEFREDPATGSACANLGGWCLAMGRDLPCSVLINQGEMVGRPSLLYLDVDSAATVRVGGDVIELGQGSLHL